MRWRIWENARNGGGVGEEGWKGIMEEMDERDGAV